MELALENHLELAVSSSTSSLPIILLSQKELINSQIYELENIVHTQCQLTGVNPLSQEMAAGALCVKIGKRPRDLLNPKAIKYMQLIFSIKDAVNKKETREISARFGVTASQVREFFTSQRARVRKFIRLSREKANRSSTDVTDGIMTSHDSNEPLNPVPLETVAPISEPLNPVPLDTVAPTIDTKMQSSSSQNEVPSAVYESERHFVDNIFSSMRKEETFSGQVKLMEWILQIQNSPVLYWFSVNGGIMILATWLSQAIVEEQTSFLHVVLKVLCHLPLQKALPVHMSAVLQSVNKLRFYRASDISNRARILLSKWSKTFACIQARKRSNDTKSVSASSDDMLLTQSINQVMGDESWDLKEDLSSSVDDASGYLRKSDSSPLKLLPASADDQNKKLISGVRSSQNRERRKVLLVEQPGQMSARRSTQVSKPTNVAKGRPLSADDIQKAKLRAQYMQNKYRKTSAPSDENSQIQVNNTNKSIFSQPNILQPSHEMHVSDKVEVATKMDVHPTKVEETSKMDIHPAKVEETSKMDIHQTEVSYQPDVSVNNTMEVKSDEPPKKKCRRVETRWKTPPEFEMNVSWKVGSGENSKEIEVQKRRILREHEIMYKTNHEIPSDPKAPWDREMDYDDTLTPQIPVEQLPDIEGTETTSDSKGNTATGAGSSSQTAGEEPDLELLAELLKNPELVFALTTGQAGNLSSEETVRLLDMIKANGMNSLTSLTALGTKGLAEPKVEVSLPSPTPSRELVPNGGMPDMSKNPFSRQQEMVDHASSHGFPAAVTSQEQLPGYFVQPQILPSRTMVAEQPRVALQLGQQMISATAHHLVQPQPHVVATQVTPPQQLPASQLSKLQRTLSPQQHGSHLVNSHQSSIPLHVANTQVTVSDLHTGNTHNSPTSSFHLRTNQTGAREPVNPVETKVMNPSASLQYNTRVQPSNVPEPSYWSPMHVYQSATEYHQNHHHHENNLNTNAYQAYGGVPVPQSQRVWERNELTDEARFETWSPQNSPTRPRGHNLEDSPGYNQTHTTGRAMPRNYGYPPAHGDPGNSGSRRWNVRRR